MESFHIVPIYAALFALVFIVLSIRTIKTRRRERVAIGDGGKPDLQRAIRVHANFAEYVPLALILLAFVELQIGADWVVHALCAILLAARIAHAYGLSTEVAHFRFRVGGMQGTFFVIIASAVALLVNAVVWPSRCWSTRWYESASGMLELMIERWTAPGGSTEYPWSLWQDGRQLHYGDRHGSAEAAAAEGIEFCRQNLHREPDRITKL